MITGAFIGSDYRIFLFCPECGTRLDWERVEGTYGSLSEYTAECPHCGWKKGLEVNSEPNDEQV